MDEHDEPIARQFEDGTVAREIEHMLCMYLHDLNTIGEAESLKGRIEHLIHSAYLTGVARQLRQAKEKIERQGKQAGIQS